MINTALTVEKESGIDKVKVAVIREVDAHR